MEAGAYFVLAFERAVADGAFGFENICAFFNVAGRSRVTCYGTKRTKEYWAPVVSGSLIKI